MNFFKRIFHKKPDYTYEITKRLLEEKRDTGTISDESYHKAAEEMLEHIFSPQQSEKNKKKLK